MITIKRNRTWWQACLMLLLSTQVRAQQSNLSYIDPAIGNVGTLLQPTRPTVQLPNQIMRMHPIRADHLDDQISSFPMLVVSHRLGEAFSIKPWSRPLTVDSWKERLTYDHDLEVTRPWYYTTYLVDEEIRVEFAPGKKAGIFRFEFPRQATQKALLLDRFNKGAGGWQLIDGNKIQATETYHDDITIYLYGELSQSGRAQTIVSSQLGPVPAAATSPGKTAIQFSGAASNKVELRYAVSFVSAEQAKKNYQQELSNTSFEQLKAAGEKSWASVINQIQVQGGTPAQRRTFYSALYRCYERMVDITEGNQYYSGYDKQVHTTQRPFYVDDWSWDTYLAHHPLRTILNPAQEEDMLNSYVHMYNQSGWMPTFPVLFGDHACMNGFHSSITFLDAYRKGLRNFDIPKAYEGMRKNATEASLVPWRNGPKCELDDVYHTKGYFPALHPGEKETVAIVHPFEKRQAVAVTLGAAYDDWAVGEMAKELGKNDDHQLFNARGNNYKNLWSEKEQLFMPKDSAGNWVNINPKIDGGKGGRDYYDENNGWTYLWQVQHDVEGLKKLLGGTAAFEQKLDQLFRENLGSSRYVFWYSFPDATGNVGQYSMGNEPSFHIPYLYNYTQSPWKTQKRIRFLLDTWFKDNIFGIPGDEDGGGMTAFVVFSSMGFYPVTPGLPVYTIGSPLFERTTINLKNGKKFTLIANKASTVNKYIQQAKLDGKSLDTPWFTHKQLMAGGTLELEMGPLPNKKWGITTQQGF
ncbi:GH92 family glycosyl hydrolase [Paraflavitalea sp. CAU 1676]|uniref:GH92 family glycosyl hydrolase n=1 Tax=Paraflavitalea sp. CAU 1676 TaxID=3032598 RepID=UPI0023DABE96|nr:GH92 family glycosyl hydrolase [Paraflavitalea sp. CAU 1676]MDF2192399.1 GH92 family glycosyl hydrolase [Paraflavitalea sp. CAU 1676]